MSRTRHVLGDVLAALIDHRGKTPKKLGGDWTSDGHRVVSALNVKDSRVNDNDHHYVSGDLYARWMKEPLRAGDVLLTSEAPTGEVAYMSEDTDWVLGQRLFGLRGKEGVLDGRYLYYSLRGGDVRHQLMSRTTGTTVSGIRQSELVQIQLELPPFQEQRSIAATLGALDDKIESNGRQLQLLDDLIQATWTTVAEQANTLRRLSEVVSTQYGLTASAEAGLDGPRFLRVTDINKENWIRWRRVPSVDIGPADWDKYRLRKGDLLVARMADPGKSALYDDETVPAVFASYLVRLRARNDAEALYIFGFLKSRLYAEYVSGATTGSVQKNMNARVIVDVDLPWPEQHLMERFASIAEQMRALMNQRVRESDRLAALRDTLLPELLSGRVRVQQLEAATS